MEPIGLCGGLLVLVVLLLVAIIGLAIVAGGLTVFLARLGAIVSRAGRPEERSESDKYTLEQSSAPAPDKRDTSN